MTAALEGGEWSATCRGHTSPPGKTRYPFYRRLGGPQGRSRWAENLIPSRIQSWTVQSVFSRYTDWATWPTHIKEYLHIITVTRKRWYIPKSWPCAFALPKKCSSEKPSHSLTVPLGQAGVCTVCECLVKKKPRLLGGGPGGAGSPLEPGKPANKKLQSLLHKVTEVVEL